MTLTKSGGGFPQLANQRLFNRLIDLNRVGHVRIQWRTNMAQQFLKKLFPYSKGNGDKWRIDQKSESAIQQQETSSSATEVKTATWKPPKFDRANIRLVLYLDNDQDRKILYDSLSVKKTEDLQICQTKKKCMQNRLICSDGDISLTKKPCSKYILTNKMGSDIKLLEELMFGSVGMAYQGPSFKVHYPKNPPQMMLTKVFVPVNHELPMKRGSVASDLDSMDSFSLNSSLDLAMSEPKQISHHNKEGPNIAQSIPVDVPTNRASFDLIDEDSGLSSLTSSGSFRTSFPSASPGSNSNSFTSIHRRWMRNQCMSLEGYTMRKRNSHDNLLSQDTSSLPARRRKSKVAMGILFELNDNAKDQDQNKTFDNFFFSHITLLESHLEKLKLAVEKAHYNRSRFVDIVTEALEIFRDDVIDLYTSTRLPDPVWLNMMSHSNYRYPLCETFMKDFMSLVTKYDNKNNNFFISTLITAVLTHHLAWVATVTPAGATTSKTYLYNHSAKWVDALARSHPYNPMWAQLGDLYGAIGLPLKLARTVVVGKKADLVKKLLYILTYFIRCSDVQENNNLSSLIKCIQELNFELDSDRQDITPIREDCNSNCSIPFGNEDACSVCSNDHVFSAVKNDRADVKPSANAENSKSHPKESIEADLGTTITVTGKSIFYVSHDDNELISAPSNKNMMRSKVKSNLCDNRSSNCSMLESMDSVGPPTEDEGYDSILSSGTFEENHVKPCRLSDIEIKENIPIENVLHVNRAAVDFPYKDMERLSSLPKFSKQLDSSNKGLSKNKTEVTSPKKKSLLSEAISNESNRNSSPKKQQKLSKEQIRANFLKAGSNSLFNEYFDDDSIKTKTIDEVDEKDRVIKHPMACQYSKSSNNLTDSCINDELTNGLSEQELSHTVRLNSIGSCVRPRISSFSRQLSSERGQRPSRPSSLAPGRCRSVTPTELGRRRHLSSTGSFEIDLSDPIQNLKEIECPCICNEVDCSSIKLFDRNFGRSLLAGYSNHYLPDFVLHGTSETGFYGKLINDLQMSAQHSVLDEPIAEAVGIVADTDKWSVELCSSVNPEKSPQPIVASQLVCNLIEAVQQLWKLKMSPEFCLMHLEDRLQEIYFKSKMLAEYVNDSSSPICVRELTQVLGFEIGDLPLLVAIAGTHSHIAPGLRS